MRDPKTASASSRDSGVEQLRQFLWRVLAIAVYERDDIETVVDRVAVAEFLVAAVTLIFRCAQDSNLEGGISLLITKAVDEGFVLGKIVDDQDLDVSALQALRDAAKNFFDCRLGVVGNDEDEQPLAPKINPIRRGRFQLREIHAPLRARIAPARRAWRR